MSEVTSQQYYAKSALKVWDREGLGGGVGLNHGLFAYTRTDATANMVIKEIGWMTLEPGSSIGMHKHENNEDVYVITKGTGTFVNSKGEEIAVGPGDITIARAGDSHALKNTGKETLEFIGIIAQA